MFRSAWRVSTTILLIVGLGRAADARAQEREPLRQPDAIPTDLASALIAAGGFGMSGDPQIIVGALPEWVAGRVVLPQGARVLGSAFFGSTVVGVISIPAEGDSVLGALHRELQERGWKTPPIPQGIGGGFRPARFAGTGNGARSERPTLCRDQHVLTMWLSRQQTMTSTIIMRLGSAGAGVCNPPRMVRQGRPSPFPTLYNPAGSDADMMAMRDCFSFGGSSGTQTRLKTTMNAQGILDHYGRQLQDSGWASAVDHAIVGRTWTRKDSTGTPSVLTLTVMSAPTDTTCRTVELDVQHTREP